ncbi:50S ribosomal protein L10 [Sunxiuqinia elliptica]|uniref:Large ribosomal subunit protein uL10 n=1 Tax=Sunxiuqinia elliptica TaxID=655355 RepID=A0A4R6H4L9_9BACT|nr:50S ribosomal protein L10 [Sunxiuqinia elliptica]TDO03082.1 LSU ribosomal protein L10P [Sunxiuqinia elliptica]TDO59281.1 LSU ribosomal protein L10P [Sunxiuqinia elliptica]
MKRSEKLAIIDNLTEQINSYNHFYLADIADLNAEDSSSLRRLCFTKDVKLVVVKNTLLRKALENSEKNTEELYETLKGNTSIMFSEVGNTPAKLIKQFSKEHDKPVLKAAYVEESVYVGENQLDVLATIKSKDELLGDLVALLQSPMKTVVGQLQSGGNKIHGILQTLSEKE